MIFSSIFFLVSAAKANLYNTGMTNNKSTFFNSCLGLLYLDLHVLRKTRITFDYQPQAAIMAFPTHALILFECKILQFEFLEHLP